MWGIVDRGEVAVWAVGVGAVEDVLDLRGGGAWGLERARGCCGEGLGSEAAGGVPGVGELETVADGAGEFLACGVVVGRPGCGRRRRVRCLARSVVAPGADHAHGGGAGHAAAQQS